MELATHRSLADWVVDGVFTGPRELAHFVLINIAAGLEYCHSQNIIQNDLKPQNIFMHYSRGPVLGDIGCATRGASMFAGGTSLYIAPEYQATGGRGAPGDIWALGLTMMFVLKVVNLRDGRFAFNFHKARGQDVDATRKLQWWIEHITKQRDEVLPNCRSWATGLIQYMLDSNPVSRPTASNVLREAFRRRNEIATLAAAPHQLRAGAVHPRPYRNIKDLIIPGTGASTPKSCMQLPQQASSTQNQEWETLMANSKLQPGNGPTQILPSQGLRRAPRRNEGRSGLPQHP